MDYLSRSLKAQMRSADKLGARFVCVIGDDEMARGVVALKDMQGDTGQREVAIERAVEARGGGDERGERAEAAGDELAVAVGGARRFVALVQMRRLSRSLDRPPRKVASIPNLDEVQGEA